MVSSIQNIAAALALTALFGSSSGHMIMANPPPFGLGASLTNSPLSGSNFPCQVSGDAKTFFTRSKVTTMAVGATQSLSFTGSAVHGGGSCQLAVTSDLVPTATSVWQVILSIEGGCPSKDGTSPSTYDFAIPDSITPGDYTFAWTWISKLAGQGEYYMNCAPITVTGGKSKRSDDDAEVPGLSARDTLPDLFKANLGDLVDCHTQSSFDIVYPNPGPNLQKFAAKPNYYTPTGAGCGAVASNASSGSGSSSGAVGAGSSTAVASSSPATVVSSAAVASSSAAGFVTSKIAATSSAAAQPTSAAASPSSVVAASSVVPSKTTAASGSSSTGSSGSNVGGQSGACQSEGIFNCVGGSTYQQCASGSWTALQAMPAGTKCQEGQSAGLWARDETRERMVVRRRR